MSNNQSNNEPKWWEKTVEYKFVVEAYKEGFLKLAPLDGDHEQAGDAILQNKDSKFYLIEFKKGASSQGDEYIKYLKGFDRKNLEQQDIESIRDFFKSNQPFPDKFDSQKNVFEELKNIGKKFHFVIFGNRRNDNIELKSQYYLDYLAYKKSDIIEWTEFEKISQDKAANQNDFLAYVHKLVKLKKGKELDVIGKQGSSSSAFANVLAVNDKGETCTLLDIIESKTYQNKFGIDLLQDNLKSINKLVAELPEEEKYNLVNQLVAELPELVAELPKEGKYNLVNQLVAELPELVAELPELSDTQWDNLNEAVQELKPSNYKPKQKNTP